MAISIIFINFASRKHLKRLMNMDYKKRYMMIKDELSKLEDKESNLALLLIDNINDLEEKYPELKECEDERIRKVIMKLVDVHDENSYHFDRFSKEKCIAWLEKQGKLVEYYEDKLDRCACYYFNKGYKAALEKQGEQKIIDEEQIKKNLQDNSFRRMFEQNPAWSEEDEKLINSIIELIDNGALDRDEKDYFIEKLKSLRPQNTWKPSDEQIKVCKEVYADILSAKGFDLSTVNSELNRMEEQLKKLREK